MSGLFPENPFLTETCQAEPLVFLIVFLWISVLELRTVYISDTEALNLHFDDMCLKCHQAPLKRTDELHKSPTVLGEEWFDLWQISHLFYWECKTIENTLI